MRRRRLTSHLRFVALALALIGAAPTQARAEAESPLREIDGRLYIARPRPNDDYKARPEYKNLKSPIVQVGSTYANAGKGDPSLTLGGSGIVAGIVAGHFAEHSTPVVMTAAHLIDGKDPWVLIDGKRVPADVLIASSEYDIAYLKVAGLDISPAFVVNDDGVEPQPLLGWRLQCLAGHAKPVAASRDSIFPTCPENIPAFERLKEVQFLPPVNQDTLPRGIMLSPSWASAGSETGISATGITPEVSGVLPWTSPAPVFRGFDGMTNQISARVTPGNSGSLAVDPAGRYVFLGVPVLYNHYFHQSTLAGPTAFTWLNRAYWKGSKGSITSSRWTMRNGLLHLSLADGTLDADFNRVPTGQGLSDPPGGVSGPPGGHSAPPGGVSGPPGGHSAPPGGHSAPPGDPCASSLGTDAAEALLAAQTGAVIAKLAPPDPRDLYREYGITPFMSSGGGQRVYGYPLLENGSVQKITLYPNVEGWRFTRGLGSSAEYSIYPPLNQPPSFPDLLAQKRIIPLQKLMNRDAAKVRLANGGAFTGVLISYPGNPPHPAAVNGFIDASPASPMTIPADRERRDVVEVSWDNSGIGIDWRLLRARPGAQSADGKDACLDSARDFTLHDTVHIDLDAQGRLAGRTTFEPVVRVKGSSGAEYYLDLRPLFYTDLSIAYPSTSRATYGYKSPSLIEFAGQTGLVLREVNPGAEGYANERFVEFNETETRSQQMRSYGCTRR